MSLKLLFIVPDQDLIFVYGGSATGKELCQRKKKCVQSRLTIFN